MDWLQSQVSELTTPKPIFRPSVESADTNEIFKRIKSDWEAFLKCPWAKEIQGTLALLKYYVENGERARFWSGEFENLYGFRLRSRDHDWIKGNIFIDVSGKPASGKEPLEFHDKHGGWVVRIGRMYLLVESEPERSRY